MVDEADISTAFHASQDTIEAIARLHAEHHASATLYQRTVDNVIAFLSRPSFLLLLTLLVLAWVGVNGSAGFLGLQAFDPPPYQALSCLLGLASLYLVVLVLTAQRRDGSLSRRRELLTLELAILSEQKTTKVIALLEELRRDTPAIQDRVDEQANAMARHADPQVVLEAIKEARSEAQNA